ncbi:MAG: ABC transporter permease [Chloroflexi bacterium]|nr:ABC transporter permease [Chloroflexota bacterium]
MLGISVVLLLVLLGLVGTLLTSPEMRRTGAYPVRLPPGQGTLLGTDSLGRNIAIQLSEAILKSLQVGLLAAALGTFFGALIGFASGYFGKLVDAVLRVLIDVFLSVPSLVFLILIASLVKGVGVQAIALIIGMFAWASPARQSRAQVLSLKERGFVQIARLSGMSGLEIVFLELMPNMFQWLGANFVNAFLAAVLAEAGLSLLGLGPQRDMTLGMMIYWALSYGAILQNLWWWWLLPVLTLMCLFLSLYLIHLGLDEVSNPRLAAQA